MPGNSNSGRRSQPAQVLQMKGRRPGVDSGGRKIPEVPKFRRAAPEPPEWLSPEARAEWDRVVPGLQLLDILKEEDRANLAAYCETWATFVLAVRNVQDNGETIEHTVISHGPNGRTERTSEIVNPFIAVARAAGKELRGFAAQFGLTPSSETALGKAGGGDDGGEDNPFE